MLSPTIGITVTNPVLKVRGKPRTNLGDASSDYRKRHSLEQTSEYFPRSDYL